MIIFERKEFTTSVGSYFWVWGDITIEPPFKGIDTWAVSNTSSTQEFDTLSEARQYVEGVVRNNIILMELGKVLSLIEKDRKAEEEMALITVQNGRYEEVGRFPSKSRPGEFYIVKLDATTGDYTCNCPAWTYKADGLRSCKHTRMLVDNQGMLEIKTTLRELKTTSKRSERLNTENRLQKKPKANPTVRKLLLD